MLQKPVLVRVLKFAHVGGSHEEAKKKVILTTT